MLPALHPFLLVVAVAGVPEADAGGYAYVPAGRRDPFRDLRVAEAPVDHHAATVDAVALRGIVKSHGSYRALLAGADGRAWLVAAGHRLAVVVVESIDEHGSRFRQRLLTAITPVNT